MLAARAAHARDATLTTLRSLPTTPCARACIGARQLRSVVPAVLRVMTLLLPRCPDRRAQRLAGAPESDGGRGLIHHVFHACLFARPSAPTGCGSVDDVPKCKTTAARNCAMRLLTVLARGHGGNTSLLCQLLALHHTSTRPKPVRRKAAKWDLTTTSSGRSPTGYDGPHACLASPHS